MTIFRFLRKQPSWVGLLVCMLLITPTVAQNGELEPGAYAVSYNVTARTECEDGFEESFDANELLEELEFTSNITSVSANTIVVDGNEYNRNGNRFFYIEPDLFDAEQNINFENRASFIVNSPTEIQGTFRVNYTVEGEAPCSNFFRFTAERIGDVATTTDSGELETGTYEIQYVEMATTQCEGSPAGTFPTLDEFDSLTDTIEVETVTSDTIIIEGNEYTVGGPESAYTFIAPEAREAERDVTFTDRVTFIVTSATTIEGAFLVNYQFDGEAPCVNTFSFTGQKVGVSGSDSASTGNLEVGTYNVQYAETATVQCGNDPEESFPATDFFGADLTDVVEVETVTSNTITIDGDDYTLGSDGSYSLTFPETYDSDRGLTVVNRLTFTTTSSTRFEGALFADFVFDSDGIPCIETYPFTAQQVGSSDSASNTAIMLETGTFEGELATTTNIECTDGSSETLDSSQVWDGLEFALEVDSVSAGTIVILGDTFTRNADGTYTFVGDTIVEDDGFEFNETIIIEITSPTTISGTYIYNFTELGEVPCTEITPFRVEKL